MKTLEFGNLFVEVYKSLKEAIKDLLDRDWKNNDDSDSVLYVEYKDGTHYYSDFDDNNPKKSNIKRIVLSHANGYAVYGEWEDVKEEINTLIND